MTRSRGPGAATAKTTKRGRPTKATPALFERICSEIADGKSLRKICDAAGMPARSNVQNWLTTNKDFRDQYARAKLEAADLFAELVLQAAMSATKETVHVARLKVDALKWMAAKLAPKRWGDAVRHEHTNDPDSPVTPAKTTVTFNIVRPPPIPDKYADELADLEPAK